MFTPARSLVLFPHTCQRIPFAALAALVAGLWCGLAVTPAGAAMAVVGDLAGDFQLTDLQGGEVQLQQLLKERPVLVVFSSVGCIPCEESVPAVQRAADRFADRLAVLCVMLSDPSKVRHWLDAGARYPGARILVGANGSDPYAPAREYGVMGTPTTFLVGQDGAVLWRHVGRITAEQVDGLRSILGVAAKGAVTDLMAQRSEP